MEIKYELLEEDYIKFNLYHMENSSSNKSTYYTLKFLLPIIAGAVMFTIGSFLFDQPKLYWGIVAILFISIWILRFKNIFERIIKKSVKKMLKEGDNSSMLCEYTMTVNDEDIHIIGKHSSETISRSGIKDVKVYDDLILIYVSSVQAHIIPTRYLTDHTKAELLKELAVY